MGHQKVATVSDGSFDGGGTRVEGHHDPGDLLGRLPELQANVIPGLRELRWSYFVSDSNYI
ncbi:hypothetical protein GMST_20580 [Geomonas silvestris]|uniref:Uncharacterized protein n=1 Tax=Geomonas silvestris TaxID=2740184 RepID=A0A6V8MIV7_9BACT|nr:hypothetical protein GMST_20580 [Geomonas silvestris]